jgi:hypothetical protein
MFYQQLIRFLVPGKIDENAITKWNINNEKITKKCGSF